MGNVTLYHNPACSHSRGALALLTERGVGLDIIEYLKTPPSREALEGIIAILQGPVAEMVRKDRRFDELKLVPGNYTTKEAVVGLLLEHPELMQRPIVIHGGKALIARPADKLSALL